MTLSRILVLVLVALLLGGCNTKVRQSFEGYESDAVWTAMKTVAQQPRYDDWNLITNDVWIDNDDLRIEVFRELRRVSYSADNIRSREDREWKFGIELDPLAPPTATFQHRGVKVPAWVWVEAQRYYDDVTRLLETESLSIGASDVEPFDQP